MILKRLWPGQPGRWAAFVTLGSLLLLGLSPARVSTPPWRWERAEAGLSREAITLAVAVRPENPEQVWASYYAPGGVMASRDGGQTWVQAAEGLAGQPVFDLLITPPAGAEAARVWAATRAGPFWYDEADQSWLPAPGELPPTGILALAADPGGRLYLGLDEAGVYAQTSDRSGWTMLTPDEPLASAGVLAVAVSPDSRQLYLGTSGRGLWASRDGGRTWTSAYPAEYSANVAFNPADPAIAVASLRDRVVRTVDGGQTWRTLAVPWDREWTVSLLWLADGSLMAGTARGRFFHSQDNGDSWSGGTSDLPPHGVLDLALAEAPAPDRPTRLLAGSWVGLYHSDDGGESWQPLAPAVGSPNVETLLATEQGLVLGSRTGLYRWETDTDRWVLLPNQPPGGIVSLATDPRHPQRLYAGLVGEGVYRSSDAGESWQSLPALRKDIPAIAVNPHNPDNLLILAAWERVYESLDGGRSWLARWDGLGEVLETVSLEVDPQEPLVYVGTELGLYRREDGKPWQEAAAELADQSILALLARPDPTSPQGTILYIGTTRGVYRSLDRGRTVEGAGLTWGRGLEDISVTALLAHPRDENKLYAGTAGRGVFASGDGGQSWQSIGPLELSEGLVESMAWGPQDQLFVLTADQIWRGHAP